MFIRCTALTNHLVMNLYGTQCWQCSFVLYYLAWIMDMFLLYNSIVYTLSCVIVHVLTLIYLVPLIWSRGCWLGEENEKAAPWTAASKCWTEQKQVITEKFNVFTMQWDKRKVFHPPNYNIISTTNRETKTISNICILSVVWIVAQCTVRVLLFLSISLAHSPTAARQTE